MYRRAFLASVGAAIALSAVPAFASGGQQKFELFGLDVFNMSRDEIRAGLKKAGLKALREDNNYWHDNYDPSGQLKGATKAEFAYVDATGEFVGVVYTFPSRMDTGQLKRIAEMVESKYGKFHGGEGNWDVGAAHVFWKLPGGIQIMVNRGWPNTTTMMDIAMPERANRMHAEIAEVQKRRKANEAKAQSHAF